MRFGVVSRGRVESRAVWREKVRGWDGDGFDLLLTPDHLGMWPPLLPLVAAAEISDRLRLGTHVLNAGFVNAALLARDAAALDVLSDGRLELGFGAGYAVAEYAAAGLAYPPPGRRIEVLEHVVVAVRRLLAGETVDDPALGLRSSAIGFATVQHRVPILIGGNGDRLLGVAARHADIVHLLGLTSGTSTTTPSATHFDWDGLANRIEYVRSAAEGRATPPTFSVMVQEVLPENNAAAGAARAERLGLSPEAVLASPFCAVGSVAAIREHLDRLAELGVGTVTVLEEHAGALVACR